MDGEVSRSILRGRGLVSSAGLLHRNVHRFRGGLVFKARRRLYHSTLGLKAIRKKKKLALSPSLLVAQAGWTSGDKSRAGIAGVTLHSHVH